MKGSPDVNVASPHMAPIVTFVAPSAAIVSILLLRASQSLDSGMILARPLAAQTSAGYCVSFPTAAASLTS
ncbi:hypothetical protein D3C72_2571600 [compost metagenome]